MSQYVPQQPHRNVTLTHAMILLLFVFFFSDGCIVEYSHYYKSTLLDHRVKTIHKQYIFM